MSTEHNLSSANPEDEECEVCGALPGKRCVEFLHLEDHKKADSPNPRSVALGGEGPDQSEEDKALRKVIDEFLVEWIDGEMVYAETDNLIQKISDAGFEFVWWGADVERVEVERRG